MAGKSNIEWTGHTWNPLAGCSVLTPGCTNCYAMKMAARLEAMGQELYAGLTKPSKAGAVWTGVMRQAPEHVLLAPLKRKVPTTYFVNSMSDLFHENVPDEWIDKVFAVMALCPQHKFQVLTKRAKRMQDYCSNPRSWARVWEAKAVLIAKGYSNGGIDSIWPLHNVWLGVSTERQQEADERIPLLLQTPAAIRFISAEPLLGPIDIDCPDVDWMKFPEGNGIVGDRLKIDWVIVGGESGHDARPMHPDWARSLRQQCQAAGVAFFFKQWGNWHPEIDRDRDDPDWCQPYADYKAPHFQLLNLAGGQGFHGERLHVMRFCSKKSTGRSLDGVEYNEMPGRA